MNNERLMNLDLDVHNLLNEGVKVCPQEAALYSRVLLMEDDMVESSHVAIGDMDGMGILITSLLTKENKCRGAILIGLLNYLDNCEHPNDEVSMFFKFLHENDYSHLQ